MEQKKVRHLIDPATGKTVCGIAITDNIEATGETFRFRLGRTCKRCERITAVGD